MDDDMTEDELNELDRRNNARDKYVNADPGFDGPVAIADIRALIAEVRRLQANPLLTVGDRTLEQIIVGALKCTVDAHGPIIEGSWLGSAAKRIRTAIRAE